MDTHDKQQMEAVLEADLRAYGRTTWTPRDYFSGRFIDRIIAWQRRWRWLEYNAPADEALTRVRVGISWRVHVRSSAMLGFTIPTGVFGPGLQIAHVGTIVVNEHARIGARCRIHPSTSIGGNDQGAPRLGDNCYVGPGARVIGDVSLGNNVTVGANAVVTRSFDEDDLVLVGAPARVLRRHEPWMWRP